MTSVVVDVSGAETDGDQIALAERIARHEYWEHRDLHGDPYIRHASRVVELVPEWARPAAWLHDALEICGLDAPRLMAAGVTGSTVDAVVLLSRRGIGTEDADFDEHIEAIATTRSRAGTIARRVKVASLSDHVARASEVGAPSDPTYSQRLTRAKSIVAAAMKIYGEETEYARDATSRRHG